MAGKWNISHQFYFLLAISALLLPFRWWMAVISAALVHELCHLLMIWMIGEDVLLISLDGGGARIEASSMSPKKEALCALAGPLGSFSCMLVSMHYPEMAVCGLIQGVYNLLPVYPLDGGRVLKCLLSPEVFEGTEISALVLLSGICLWICTKAWDWGLILLFFLWLPRIQRKSSCKEGNLAVQ